MKIGSFLVYYQLMYIFRKQKRIFNKLYDYVKIFKKENNINRRVLDELYQEVFRNKGRKVFVLF